MEEVERGGGLEMSKNFGAGDMRNIRRVSESKENMVLESRVEILVVDGEESEEGDWDGVWDEDEDEDLEEEDGGMGRGRMAMSLPRRVY